MSRKTHLTPNLYAETIDSMIAADIRVKAFCGRCNGFFKVDLDLLRRAYGGCFSLVNRRGTCRRDGCDGSCTFLYAFEHGSFVPLRRGQVVRSGYRNTCKLMIVPHVRWHSETRQFQGEAMDNDPYGQAFDKAKAEREAEAQAERELEEKRNIEAENRRARGLRLMTEVVNAELQKADASLKSRGAMIETKYGGNTSGKTDFLQVMFRIRDNDNIGRSSGYYKLSLDYGFRVERITYMDPRSPIQRGHSVGEDYGIENLDDLTPENMQKFIMGVIMDDYHRSQSLQLTAMD